MKNYHIQLTTVLLALCMLPVYAQQSSRYYKKGNNWQESVSSTIKFFHQERERVHALLQDESSITLGDWYSVGTFPGDREELHSMEFGPEKDSRTNQVYEGGQKWIQRTEWKDGHLHHFEGVAAEVTYLQRLISCAEEMQMLAYVSSDDGLHVWLNGSLVFENDADRGLEPSQEVIPLSLKKGDNRLMLKINNRGGMQGYFFSFLPDPIVYKREMEKMWYLASKDFPDPASRFQMERERKDEIWESQIAGYSESDLMENYQEKINRIPAIADYGRQYMVSAKESIDISVLRGLYYISCKFDNILYLDDAREPDDETWNKYKSGFETKAKEAASVLTSKNRNEGEMGKSMEELDLIFDEIPLLLPSGPASSGGFGAYYTTLKYDLDWDKNWRIGDNADVVVNFDKTGYKFVFWRGTSYIPCWVTETGVWYTNEFVERRGFHSPNTEGCVEPMSDKQCRYSHVRIIESNDARVVVHWRYAPVDVYYEQPFTDPVTGWSDWVDEVYTIYPSGVGVRKVTVQTNRPELWMEFQEMIVINQPGTMPEDNIEPGAVSLANMNGESKTYYWNEQGGPEFEEGPEHASIFKVNLKADYSPFALVSPPTEEGNLITSYLGHAPTSIFNFWDHWPVSQDASDGRTATSAERPSHSSLGHIGLPGMADMEWAAYEADGIKRTKIMLHGMTDLKAEDLVPLAKSWLHAPELQLNSGNYSSAGFDPTQSAYIISRMDVEEKTPLSITLNPTKESPTLDPAFVINNWGRADFSLKLNGELLRKDLDYRAGYHQMPEGYKLIIWLNHQSVSTLNLEIQEMESMRE